MRLYRGLKNPYRPERVDASRFSATNFTDCPALALLYASSSRGVLLVVDIEQAAVSVSEAYWPERDAKRHLLWGRFDHNIVAILPAKDLRTRLRLEGHRDAILSTKSRVLRAAIDDGLRKRALRSQMILEPPPSSRTYSHE